MRTILINTSEQQGDTKRPTHDALLVIPRLSESQGQVTDGLGAALDSQRLGVVEGMVLAFDTGMLDQGPGICLQTGHGAANVLVDLNDLLDGGGLEEAGGDTLLDT